jgi:hypothetical protein
MRIIEQRFKNLVAVLNENIGLDLKTAEWTELVNKKVPYGSIKPPNRWGTIKCSDSSHKQINATYLTVFTMMGYVQKTEVTPNSGKKVKYFKYKVLKEIPYQEIRI